MIVFASVFVARYTIVFLPDHVQNLFPDNMASTRLRLRTPLPRGLAGLWDLRLSLLVLGPNQDVPNDPRSTPSA